ncbi:MAG: C40 family peptidase [Ferruginibacter sp.]
MRNLLFVSVAVGILSGTSISVKAQTSVNIEKFGTANQPRFIEGIEVKQVATDVVQPVKLLFKTAKPLTAVGKTVAGKSFATAIEDCSSLQFKYAQLMNTEVESISNFVLYDFIEEWWGTHYRYGGTTKQGVDCSAYTGYLLQSVYGMKLPRTAREQFAVTQRVSKEELLEGDLVFFNTRGGVSHVGVYLGNGYFTHSSSHGGVTISSLDEDYYSRKYIGAGRVNETPVVPEELVAVGSK